MATAGAAEESAKSLRNDRRKLREKRCAEADHPRRRKESWEPTATEDLTLLCGFSHTLRPAWNEFERRTEANGVPHDFQNLHARIVDLENAYRRLRETNTEQTERIEVYARGIREITTEVSRLRQEPTTPTNVRHLPVRSPALT